MRRTRTKLPPHFTCTRCGRHRLAENIGAAPGGVVCADGCKPRDCRCKDPHCTTDPCEVCHEPGELSDFQRIHLSLQQSAHRIGQSSHPADTVLCIDHVALLRA